MKRIFLFGLMALSQLNLFSQVLKGRVLEKESGSPLSAASVVVDNQSTVSDDNGFFQVKLKSLTNGILEISHVEFESINLDLSGLSNKITQQNGTYLFYLERKPFFLTPVEVTSTRSPKRILPGKTLKRLTWDRICPSY